MAPTSFGTRIERLHAWNSLCDGNPIHIRKVRDGVVPSKVIGVDSHHAGDAVVVTATCDERVNVGHC